MTLSYKEVENLVKNDYQSYMERDNAAPGDAILVIKNEFESYFGNGIEYYYCLATLFNLNDTDDFMEHIALDKSEDIINPAHIMLNLIDELIKITEMLIVEGKEIIIKVEDLTNTKEKIIKHEKSNKDSDEPLQHLSDDEIKEAISKADIIKELSFSEIDQVTKSLLKNIRIQQRNRKRKKSDGSSDKAI
ncbi:hypothetical protein [Priestia megaterium]